MEQNREAETQRRRALIAMQQASGRSMACFCREHELCLWRFYVWKKRLQQHRPAEFVAVSLQAGKEAPAQLSAALPSSVMELRHPRGWSVMVEAGFDATHLRRQLSVLEPVWRAHVELQRTQLELERYKKLYYGPRANRL